MADTFADLVHSRTIDVLRDVGLVWPDSASLIELEKKGFEVDQSSQTVRMSPARVEAALEQAPRHISLYPRDQSERLTYDKGPLLMAAGTGVAVIDLETGERRPSTSTDVAQLVRIQDALANIDIARPIITMNDVPPEHSGLVEYALALCNTTKHVHHRVLAPEDVDLLIEIGAAIAGSIERLRERPLFSGVYCPLSPLAYTPDNVKCILGYAKYGIPFQVLSQALLGANSPPTMLGPVIVTNAEVVGTITILHSLVPGTPVMYGAIPTPMDMRSGLVTYGTPEIGPLVALVGQMARYYGLVSVLIGLRTDAKQCDEQAGFEKAINLWPVLPVADIIYGAGNLDTGLTCGYDQLVLDDELMGAARRQMNWKPCGDGQLEVEMIKQTGPKGDFLSKGGSESLELTARAAKEFWYPKFFVRGDYEAWATERKDAGSLALEKAREILDTHAPPALPPETVSEIKRIVERRVGRGGVPRAFG